MVDMDLCGRTISEIMVLGQPQMIVLFRLDSPMNTACMHALISDHCVYLNSVIFYFFLGGGEESFTPLGEESVTPLAECSLVIDSYLFLKHGTRVFNQRQNRKHVKRISPTSFVWGRGEWRQ